jgi:transcriptional regulator with GAF, ATPase, and Fis domain
LNVFPIRIAPLRERGHDIVLLARAFVTRFASKMRKSLAPLPPEFIERLNGYEWPGNIRELENVIERAVITARDGRLDLDRAFPEATPSDPGSGPPARIRTRRELDDLERQNLVRALDATQWKIAGEGGAAELLGMKASTLSSRLKALKIKRSR